MLFKGLYHALECVTDLAGLELFDVVGPGDDCHGMHLCIGKEVRECQALALYDAGSSREAGGHLLDLSWTERTGRYECRGDIRNVQPAVEPFGGDFAPDPGYLLLTVLDDMVPGSDGGAGEHSSPCLSCGEPIPDQSEKKVVVLVLDCANFLDNVLAEEADRVGHVRPERGSEDDLGDTGLCQVLALLLDRVGGSGDGEGINGLVIDVLSGGLEVELCQGILDVCHLCGVETMALEKVWGRAGGDEGCDDLGGVPGLLLVRVD